MRQKQTPSADDLYKSLDVETRIVVQQRTSEIKTLMRRTAQDIVDIGQKLIEVKDRLGHGRFDAWLCVEFEWSLQTAKRFMNVAQRFQNKQFVDFDMAPSALYLLAAPSAPDSAREEALLRAEQHEPITHRLAQEIITAHRAMPVFAAREPATRLPSLGHTKPKPSTHGDSVAFFQRHLAATLGMDAPGVAPTAKATAGGRAMRLEPILPQVEPTEFKMPLVCPHQGCQGRHFTHHQEVDKALNDTMYEAVVVHRYRCLRCEGTFRVYPLGVTRAQTSRRVKGLAVLLYLLGLSYGATSLALEALGVFMSKTSVYEAVQAAAEKVPGLKRNEVFAGLRTPALGGDLTSVKCNGEWLSLSLAVDDTTGLVLTVDDVPAEDAETLRKWLEPIAEAVKAKLLLLVSDDADAFKTVANELGLEHQVCKGHVKRNTETFIENLEPKVALDEDGSLAARRSGSRPPGRIGAQTSSTDQASRRLFAPFTKLRTTTSIDSLNRTNSHRMFSR